ncbi:MAG: hypothetical protein LUE13_02390 [Akkermansiaceae bacterium]|nr:hypothetical protein [Akkermansiaceae bacterium]
MRYRNAIRTPANDTYHGSAERIDGNTALICFSRSGSHSGARNECHASGNKNIGARLVSETAILVDNPHIAAASSIKIFTYDGMPLSQISSKVINLAWSNIRKDLTHPGHFVIPVPGSQPELITLGFAVFDPIIMNGIACTNIAGRIRRINHTIVQDRNKSIRTDRCNVGPVVRAFKADHFMRQRERLLTARVSNFDSVLIEVL